MTRKKKHTDFTGCPACGGRWKRVSGFYVCAKCGHRYGSQQHDVAPYQYNAAQGGYQAQRTPDYDAAPTDPTARNRDRRYATPLKFEED